MADLLSIKHQGSQLTKHWRSSKTSKRSLWGNQNHLMEAGSVQAEHHQACKIPLQRHVHKIM